MGQGARFTIVNGTPFVFEKVRQDAYQMNQWDFPQQIGPFSSQTVYIEWSGSIFKDNFDSQAHLEYKIDTKDPSDDLKIGLVAIVQERRRHIFAGKSFASQTQPVPAQIDLGWDHDGVMSYAVIGDKHRGFITTGFDASTWMQNNLKSIGERTLQDVCMPGSHDAGMSILKSPTIGSFACNTKTQSNSIAKQLDLGVRYFDIRPIIGSGEYHTGHYSKVINSWQGSRGESIRDIVASINKFTENKSELIVLFLSHALDTDHDNNNYKEFTRSQLNGLLKELKNINHLYAEEKGVIPDFRKMPLRSLIDKSSKVLVVLEKDLTDLNPDFESCFFPYNSLGVYDKYSGTNDLNAMAADQFYKMAAQKLINSYFLLSWTLTQSDAQAAGCFIDPTGITRGIFNLATEANQNLPRLMMEYVNSIQFPNIIFIDYVADSNAALMAMYVNNILGPHKKANLTIGKNIYLGMDARDVDAFKPNGGGLVYCQYGSPGPLKGFTFILQGDGIWAIESIEFPNVVLRIDGNEMRVNCQFKVGPCEKFRLVDSGNAGFKIESCQFEGMYLRLDTNGANESIGSKGGLVKAVRGSEMASVFFIDPIKHN